ncbi:MAG: right-handed parallel beta-helix repeat-containing protein, partial [Lentimicrobiaceae bacterium]|nr:right-handed parallel beta-helix repeat-containing protein [Lentimicrobiaceae bacterium]
VDHMVNESTIGVKIMHGQQQGFQFARAGDTISLADAGTLKPYAKLEVTEVKEINSEHMELTCKEKVGDILRANSVANNLSWQPNLIFKNSVVRRNRARSILISTAGDVLVEGNHFESCTFTSILFEGDATFWYESGPVRNVIIRNNYFKNFGLHGGNAPVVQISPRTKPVKDYYYHRNILFENNTCEVFSRLLVNARSVENFHFVGNIIKASKDYPLDKHGAKVFSFDHCSDILIKDNVAEKGWPGLDIKGMKSILRYYKQ